MPAEQNSLLCEKRLTAKKDAKITESLTETYQTNLHFFFFIDYLDAPCALSFSVNKQFYKRNVDRLPTLAPPLFLKRIQKVAGQSLSYNTAAVALVGHSALVIVCTTKHNYNSRKNPSFRLAPLPPLRHWSNTRKRESHRVM